MIGVHVQPLADNASLHWVEAATPADCFGLVRPTNDSTNTASRVSVSTSLPKHTRVDRAIEYTFAHYGDLMRRLAD